MHADGVMWIVHFDPLDFPGMFVARRWLYGLGGTRATSDLVVDTSLEKVRAQLPMEFIRVPRHFTDDPKIVEVWL